MPFCITDYSFNFILEADTSRTQTRILRFKTMTKTRNLEVGFSNISRARLKSSELHLAHKQQYSKTYFLHALDLKSQN